MQFATRAIHAGQESDPAYGDVAPPIHLTTVYEFEAPGETKAGFDYIRNGNPTRAALEACLASLENGPENCPALCFSSGMAAIDGVFRLLKPGEKVVVAQDVYGGTTRLVEDILIPMGIEVEYVDMTQSEPLQTAVSPNTRLIWIESPSNPLLHLTDIAVVVQAAQKVGALVAIDSTFGTPYFQNPLDLGVDIVMHSTTKYLGGHSDLLGGVLIVKDLSLRQRLAQLQKWTGAVASPFDCWLTLRGVRSLAPRMRLHESNALAVATFLASHPKVKQVYYPGLPSHPHHELAKRQMRGFGGMVAVELKGGEVEAKAVMQKIKVFTLAASLGGVESIMSYPALMSHVFLTREERYQRGITDGLLRLSIGLEDSQDLIADLDQALFPC